MKHAKFEIGETIIHIKQEYRGIIVDADESFLTSEGRPLLRHSQEKSINEPWYKILIDESDVVSYVRESLLKKDPLQTPIEHPKLSEYFSENKSGNFTSNRKVN